MKKINLFMVVLFLTILTACSSTKVEKYEGTVGNMKVAVSLIRQNQKLLKEEVWSESTDIPVSSDQDLKNYKEQWEKPYQKIKGYTVEVSRSKEGNLLLHTTTDYQQLDLKAFNQLVDKTEDRDELMDYDRVVAKMKKDGLKQIR